MSATTSIETFKNSASQIINVGSWLQWIRKSPTRQLFLVLISLNIFIALAHCDDDTQSTQLQKRSGGKRMQCDFTFPSVDGLFSFVAAAASNSGNNGVLDVKDHCNKTVEIYEDVSSPDLTSANRNRPLLCTYRFRSFRGAPRDWVLRIRFKRFKVGNILNATHCGGGYLQVLALSQWIKLTNWTQPFY